MKKLIVTADDFGLSEKINSGIIQAHQRGIVTAASLLVNVPATTSAIKLATENPKLEIGLHLAIVESFCTSQSSALLTSSPYWDGPCLPRDWKEFFLGNYYLNQEQWFHEFELQIQQFLSTFERIPFINSTQHLHLLPGLQDLVHRLCLKYKIPFIRLGRSLISSRSFNQRPIQASGIKMLSTLCSSHGLKSVGHLLGTDEAGHLDTQAILRLLQKLPEGISELIVHPGWQDIELIHALPKTYSAYNWESELNAIISHEVRVRIEQEKITLTNFSAI